MTRIDFSKARYLAGDEVGLKQRRQLIEQVEELRAAQASCLAEAKGSLDDLEAEELEDGPEVAGRIRASLGEILRSVEQLEESSDSIYARWDAAIAKAEPEVLAERARGRRGQTLERQQQLLLKVAHCTMKNLHWTLSWRPLGTFPKLPLPEHKLNPKGLI